MQKTTNTPCLRFPQFHEEWECKELGELFEFITTNSLSRSQLNYEKGTVKNIHYGDIHTKFKPNFDITKEDVPFINEDIDTSKLAESSFCKVGDLVIADASEDYNDIGKTIEIVNIDNQKLVAGLHTYIARDKQNATAVGFKGYLMRTYNVRLQMMKVATGISVLGITKGNLSKILLHLPTLPEQTQIASFLTCVDERLQLLQRKKELLEQYKKGVMQQIFSQTLRFQDEAGKDFPEWEEKSLGEVFAERNERGFENEELLSVTMNEGVKRRADIEGKDNSSEDKSNYKRVLINDIAYNSMRMWQGANGVSPYNGIVSPAYTVLKPLENAYPLYFGYLFKTPKMINIFERNSQGLTSDTWNLKYPKLATIKISLPSLPEQKQIADFLTALDAKIAVVGRQVGKLQEWKKGLLQEMFV